MKVTHHLSTPRLTLRPHAEADLDDLIAMDTDPEVMRYIGPCPEPEAHRAQAAKHIAIYPSRDSYGWWAIEQDGRYLGWVILKELPGGEHFEVGYRLHTHAWGRGIATEAATRVALHAIDDLELPVLCGITHPDNEGSKNVLRKLGMRFLREARHYDLDVHYFEADARQIRATLASDAQPRPNR